MDKAEATGFGIAAAGHIALLVALSLGFATMKAPPITNPPIEVSFVDEVALTSAAPSTLAEPPPQSVAPDPGPPEETAPAPIQMPAPPEPQVVERPPPSPAPKAQPRPEPRRTPQPKAATPKQKAAPKQPKANGKQTAERPRGSRLGRDFLKGIGPDPSPARVERPTGATMSRTALADIRSAIERQIQPCADRQVNPGPGANKIRVTVNLRINRNGSLASTPRVVRTTGVDDENSRYEARVKELAIAAFRGCSPLRNLPEELYQTSAGGWSNININYHLPD